MVVQNHIHPVIVTPIINVKNYLKMSDYFIALLFFVGVTLLIYLNRNQPEENDLIEEDDYRCPSFQETETPDGDYWCPICGYHATNRGYFNAHLMNEHKNN